jgi:hypothetical protein
MSHFDEQPDADPHGECAAEIDKLRAALLSCARQAESLKRPCSDDPESQQAIRNSMYQRISTTAHIALGTIDGPVLGVLTPLTREQRYALVESAMNAIDDDGAPLALGVAIAWVIAAVECEHGIAT